MENQVFLLESLHWDIQIIPDHAQVFTAVKRKAKRGQQEKLLFRVKNPNYWHLLQVTKVFHLEFNVGPSVTLTPVWTLEPPGKHVSNIHARVLLQTS